MSLNTPIRTALEGNSTQYGFWLTYVQCELKNLSADNCHRIPSAALAKGILRSNIASSSATKYSWVLVDGEHGLISDKEYYEVRKIFKH